MITPQQAEQLATTTVQDYVNACHCKTEQDIANVLMKLASMCGLAMIATVGKPEAVARMCGTAAHIESIQTNAEWKREAVQ